MKISRRNRYVPTWTRFASQWGAGVSLLGLIGMAACSASSDSSPYPLVVDIAPELDGELEMQGRPEEVSLSPDGRIWLAGALGQIAVGDRAAGPWRHVGYPLLRDDWQAVLNGRSRPGLFRVVSFTPDTMIVLGMGFVAGEYSRDAPYALLRTVDGGESWDSVAYGTREWLRAGHAASTGVGWVGGGSEGILLRSTDFGATWQVVGSPLGARITSIFSASATDVVVGGRNDLSITRDGGETWVSRETPRDQDLISDPPPYGGHLLTRVAIWGDRILVAQGGHVFEASFEGSSWTELPARPQMFVVDRLDDRLYTVSSEGSVLSYDKEMRPTDYGHVSLIAPAQDVAALGDRVVVLDTEGALHEVDPSGTVYGFPLSEHPTSRFSKARLDRDLIWAVTQHQIYRSSDSGETWDRVGFAPTAIRSFLVRSDGTLLLWDGHGRNLLFRPSDQSLRPLQSLAGYDVVDILTFADRWIAFGGRQYETTGRVEVGRTYYAGQFDGSRENGFVLESTDEGANWRLIDEWNGGGVANLFVDPGTSVITLVSYLGGVRRLRPAGSGYVAEDLTLPSTDTWDAVPYVEVPSVVYFQDDRQGYIDGWIHHLGERRYETRDGGRTWSQAEPERHDVAAVPSQLGYVILTGSELDGGTDIRVASGYRTSLLFAPERPIQPPDAYPWGGITDISVEGDRVLAVVDGTEMVVLDLPVALIQEGDRSLIR